MVITYSQDSLLLTYFSKVLTEFKNKCSTENIIVGGHYDVAHDDWVDKCPIRHQPIVLT